MYKSQMRASSQVPIETHAAIYSVSLIIIFKLVGTVFSNVPNLFRQSVYQSFIVFLTGLCIRDKNQSAHGIAKFFRLNSHDALTRMLSHKSWSAGLLMLELLNQAVQLSTGSPTQSWLILDDVILHKRRSTNTVGVYWDYDYVNEKHVLCMRFVVLAWSNGTICIPVAFALYYKKNSSYLIENNKKFRTKNQLAQALVYRVKKSGLHFDCLLFDSWYASADNFNLFNRLNIHFVTSLKSNRKLRLPFNLLDNKPKRTTKYLRWYELSCSEWAAQRPAVREYRRYTTVDARARQQLVFLKDVKLLLKMVCIKNYAKTKSFKKIHTKADRRAKDPSKYLITNELYLTIPQTITLYRQRWTIEVMFRDCKQHFALGTCQAHKALEPHLRHTAMVFFALVTMELIKARGNCHDSIATTCGEIKRYLQNQQLLCINDQYEIVDISSYNLNWKQVNQLTKLIDLDTINTTETQLMLNFKR